MRTARGWGGAAAGLGVTAALVALGAPEAAAGGPTSVLLVSPESTRSAALYYSDEEYGALERMLQPAGSAGQRGGEDPPGLGIGESTRQINVTWMVHDVQPWRVDRVYPPQPGKKGKEVWVHRSTDPDSMNGDWYRAKDPRRLTSLFKELGLLGRASDRGTSGIAPDMGSKPAPTAAEETGTGGARRPAAAGGTGAPGSADPDWWWVIPGAGAGAVAALLL
ncbi:hypothetical protein, partial [Streptomyces sp. NPDC047123]|uniref:hypothetical protein n=1 Tax=Streptomyces sp. NPDC047123 TaxID=3155622 RepID=UPI0033DC0B5C